MSLPERNADHAGSMLHYPDDPRAAACEDQYLWGMTSRSARVEKDVTHARFISKGNLVRFLDR